MSNRAIGGIAAGVVVGFIALCVLAASTWISVDSSHATLVWNAGLFDSRDFDQVVAPGSGKTPVGISQKTVEIPTGQRQWTASNDTNVGRDYPDTILVSVRGMQMAWEPTMRFTINTSDKDGRPLAVDFYERELRQFGATDFDNTAPDAKWVGYLNTRIQPIVRNALQQTLTGRDPVALRFDSHEGGADVGAREQAAKDVSVAVSQAIESTLGARYLCGPAYHYGQPASACGDVQMILPEPEVNDAVRDILEAPQRAKVTADNKIAEAEQTTRQATGVAEQRAAQVGAEQQSAAAESAIQAAKTATQTATATNDLAPCRTLGVTNGLDCALLIASLRDHFPTVLGGTVATTAR